jgi:uncharacterized protein RhaS with RHS repeats
MSWTYDASGRVLTHTDLGGHTTNYLYNKNGLLIVERGSSGKHLAYDYLSDGKLAEFDDLAHNEVIRYSYTDPVVCWLKISSITHKATGYKRR